MQTNYIELNMQHGKVMWIFACYCLSLHATYCSFIFKTVNIQYIKSCQQYASIPFWS